MLPPLKLQSTNRHPKQIPPLHVEAICRPLDCGPTAGICDSINVDEVIEQGALGDLFFRRIVPAEQSDYARAHHSPPVADTFLTRNLFRRAFGPGAAFLSAQV